MIVNVTVQNKKVTISNITGYTNLISVHETIVSTGSVTDGTVETTNTDIRTLFLTTSNGAIGYVLRTNYFGPSSPQWDFIFFTSASVVETRTITIAEGASFDCYVPDASSTINLSLQNNSTVQQIKYKVGAGAETTLNAGASAQISDLGSGAVLGVNPILSARPITFNSNGRIASVGYNGVNYTQFPTNINVDVSGTPSMMLNGTQAPTVTVNYSNTNEPVITNT